MIPAEYRQFVATQIVREIKRLERKLDQAVVDLRQLIAKQAPRRFEIAFTPGAPLPTGATEIAVTWNAPMGSDYTVIVEATVAAAAVGLVAGGLKVSTKTATGCTVIVNNRTGNTLVAAFDVIAIPH